MNVENIRNVSIGIAVMILLPFTCHVGIELFLQPERARTDYLNWYKSAERETYDKHYFVSMFIAGFVAILLGTFVVPIPSLGMGFILGGSFALIASYTSYWAKLAEIYRFISLIAALFLLIFSSFWLMRGKAKG